HAAANGDLAGKPPCDECKVRRDRHGRRCYDWRVRAREAPVEAIQKGGGKDVRLLECENLTARTADLVEIRVCSRIGLFSVIDEVVNRERFFVGHVVVK